MSKPELITICAADIPEYVAPKHPKVSGRGRTMTLVLEDGRHYEVSENPLEFLGLLRHLTKKTWADGEFLRLAIGRVAVARGWDLGSLATDLDPETGH
jgi:hypothetical protein